MTEVSNKDLKLCHNIIFLCHDKETNLGQTLGIHNEINEVRPSIGKSINRRI